MRIETIRWDYAGADFFNALYPQSGTVQAGQYKVCLYRDGCCVNTAAFNAA